MKPVAYLVVQVEQERLILTVIYLPTLVCFLMGDKLPGVLPKVFMLANGILKIEKCNEGGYRKSGAERMVEGAVLP